MQWVLIRGLARCSAHWGAFPCQLQQAFKQPVVTIDLPGFGQYHQRTSPTSIVAMAAHALEQISKRGLEQTEVCLVGISLGGMVATELAAMSLGKISKLVLINSSSRYFARWYQRLRPAAYPTILRALVMPGVKQREPVIFTLTSRRPELSEQTVSSWLEIHRQTPCKVQNVVRQLRAAGNYHGRFKSPCKDTLILTSARDRLVHPNSSLSMAKAWNVPCEIHPDAGHDLPHDDPQWVLQQLAHWLEATEPG